MSDFMSPGQRIRHYRMLRGMTQKALGIAAGFPPETADIRWPKSAIISNTDCLIHASTAFRKTGNASTLSLIDILEPRVDEKYFLSPQATARLLYS